MISILTVPFFTHPQPVVDRRQLLRFFYTYSRRPRRQSISKWPAGAAGRLFWLPTIIIIIKTRQDKQSNYRAQFTYKESSLPYTHVHSLHIRLWVIAYNKCFICNFRFLQEMSSQLTACRVNENNKVLFCFIILYRIVYFSVFVCLLVIPLVKWNNKWVWPTKPFARNQGEFLGIQTFVEFSTQFNWKRSARLIHWIRMILIAHRIVMRGTRDSITLYSINSAIKL